MEAVLREASQARREDAPHSLAMQASEQRRMATLIEAQGGISSAGRAPALQAGGRRFDPVILHHFPGARGGWQRHEA